jgi:hypothetical protein
METNINTNVGTSLETSHTLDFSDRVYKVTIAFIAVLGVIGAGWVGAQFGALPQNAPHEISVSGTGKAYIKPDIATVTFGAHAEAPKSQDAVNQSNAKMNAIIAAIKSQGVEDKDIQTTGYNLSPVYSYERPVAAPMGVKSGAVSTPVYYPMPGNQVITGYALDQQVSVKIRNFDNINSILDKATAAGATDVGDLQFSVDNPETITAQARALAIADAKKKLADIMQQSGLQVGKLVNISEGYNNYPQPMYATGMAKDSVAATAPQIQTGQQEVDSNVTLTYQVR